MRRLFCILLLICLPLQGFAMQWDTLSPAGTVTLAHEIDHDERLYHHHDDDGSVHYDNSDESVQHIQDHSSSAQPAGLIAPSVLGAPRQLVTSVFTETSHFLPDPLPDCPHRPPSSSLG